MMALLGDNANTTQGGMRPPKLREKFSSLMRRKGSTKSKSHLTMTTTTTTTTATPRTSEQLDRIFSKNGAPLLDVNLERTRSYRLAEGWLEDESKKSPSSPNKRRNGQVGGGGREREPEKEAEDLRRQTKTPIAAMFSKSTDQLASTLETISFRKPIQPAAVSTTMLPAADSGAATSSAKTTKQGPHLSTTAVPVPVPEPEPQPIRISLHHSIVEEPVVIPPTSTQSRGRTMQGSWGIRPVVDAFDEAPQRHSIRQVGLLRSVGDNTTGLRVSGGGNGNGNGGGSAVGDSAKRFSGPSISSPVPVPVPEPTIKKTVVPYNMSRSSSLNTPAAPSSSLNPDNQRQSWQAPTSAPRTSQDGGMRPPPLRTASSRPPLTSSRLSWIRDLENKSTPSSSSSSSSSSVPELQRLKKNPNSVGVAGKLAMFEQIQKQTQPPLTPAFISRSNSRASSRSRMSSAAFTDVPSVTSGPAHQLSEGGRPLSYVSMSTARTSMDSVTRESLSISNRNSGVMAYYDQGFREKMEGVAGGWAKKLEKLAGGGKKDGDKEDQSPVEASATDGSRTEATVTPMKAEEDTEPEWKAPVALPYLAEITGGKKEQEVKNVDVEVDQKSSEEAAVLEESKTEPEEVTAMESEEQGPEEEKAPMDLPLRSEMQPACDEEEAAEKNDAVEEDKVEPAVESGAVEEAAEAKEPVSLVLPADFQAVSHEEPAEESALEAEKEKEPLALPLPADMQAVSNEEEPVTKVDAVEEHQDFLWLFSVKTQ
ncbi:hypothetical protein V8F06_008969 [Rhypophila decipiens]